MSGIATATRELLWSLWTELGVPGTKRRHQNVAIDPEPLIAWSPVLAAGDPRLSGLIFDWCVAHAAHVAHVRFVGLGREMPTGAAAASLAAMNGSLLAHGVSWEPRGNAAPRQVGRTRIALPLARPALVRFRIRALCGVTARAEVVAQLLANASRHTAVADLLPSGLTRRSVERSLNDLIGAELITAQGRPRRRTFRLSDATAFARVVRGAGLRWFDWHRALSLVQLLVELAECAERPETLRGVEAARRHAALADLALRLDLEPPPGPVERKDLFSALVVWGARVIRSL